MMPSQTMTPTTLIKIIIKTIIITPIKITIKRIIIKITIKILHVLKKVPKEVQAITIKTIIIKTTVLLMIRTMIPKVLHFHRSSTSQTMATPMTAPLRTTPYTEELKSTTSPVHQQMCHSLASLQMKSLPNKWTNVVVRKLTRI